MTRPLHRKAKGPGNAVESTAGHVAMVISKLFIRRIFESKVECKIYRTPKNSKNTMAKVHVIQYESIRSF